MATRPGVESQMVEKGAHTGARWQLLLFSIDLKLNYFGHSLIILQERGASHAEKRAKERAGLVRFRTNYQRGLSACKLGHLEGYCRAAIVPSLSGMRWLTTAAFNFRAHACT